MQNKRKERFSLFGIFLVVVSILFFILSMVAFYLLKSITKATLTEILAVIVALT